MAGQEKSGGASRPGVAGGEKNKGGLRAGAWLKIWDKKVLVGEGWRFLRIGIYSPSLSRAGEQWGGEEQAGKKRRVIN
jgi:hypothetical protein